MAALGFRDSSKPRRKIFFFTKASPRLRNLASLASGEVRQPGATNTHSQAAECIAFRMIHRQDIGKASPWKIQSRTLSSSRKPSIYISTPAGGWPAHYLVSLAGWPSSQAIDWPPLRDQYRLPDRVATSADRSDLDRWLIIPRSGN